MVKFKHKDMCWYYGKLDHRGKPYEWPCCGEISECDSDYVEAFKIENERLRDALQAIAFGVWIEGICQRGKYAGKEQHEIARAALEGNE